MCLPHTSISIDMIWVLFIIFGYILKPDSINIEASSCVKRRKFLLFWFNQVRQMGF